MAAAEQLFLSRGYELTSMDQVAKNAGVSKLTVYSHFTDKDALFKAVISRKCAHYNMPSTFTQFVDAPVEKALHGIAHNFLTLVYSDEAIRMFRIVANEAERHPKVAELFFDAGPKQVKEGFEELLRMWNKKKKLAVPDVTRACDHFFSLLKGDCHAKMQLCLQKAPNKKEKEAHIASCLHLFMSAYKTGAQR